MCLGVWPCFASFKAMHCSIMPSIIIIIHCYFYLLCFPVSVYSAENNLFFKIIYIMKTDTSVFKIFFYFQVYQSLDHELQRHVSLQDTLQQCQTWLNSVSEEPEPQTHPSISLEEALQQVSQLFPAS